MTKWKLNDNQQRRSTIHKQIGSLQSEASWNFPTDFQPNRCDRILAPQTATGSYLWCQLSPLSINNLEANNQAQLA